MQNRYLVPQRLVPRASCGCFNSPEAEDASHPNGPLDALVTTLAEAAQESALQASVDIADATRVAHQVVAFLDSSVAENGAADRPAAEEIAMTVNALCPLDRSVQAALLAIRALANALMKLLPDPELTRTWSIAAATLDLCDAIRSGQLQRRMTAYVDLKRMQVSRYVIANSLLGNDRAELRSLGWLRQTHAQAGVLGLWHPANQTGCVTLSGVYDRASTRPHEDPRSPATIPVESFPPRWILRDAGGEARLVVITQVRLEDSDWGVLAVAGGLFLQSSLEQETFQQWATLMSASLDQERANTDLDRQADELTAAYETEMALLEEVRLSEERYALAAEATRDALWDWDTASGKVYYSSNWKALLGHRDTEIGTAPDEWLSRVHPDDAPIVHEQLNQALRGVEEFIDFEHRLRASTGEYRWIACSGRSVIDNDGRPVRLVGSITDITARRLVQEQLLQEAMYDGLTGLAKGALFKDRLNQAIELAKRRSGYRFAVLFIDLNGFKAVNDNLGHAAGDELLTSIAGRLTDASRKNDTAARLGGDEFAVLLNDVEQMGDLPLIIERMQSRIGAPHLIGGRTLIIDAAIGVAVSDAGYTTAEAMLHQADIAMYQVKHRARNAVSA